MAITSTQSKNDASVVQIVVGSYLDTGTAAAFTLTLGFKPRYFRIVNETGDASMEFFEGMADAEAMKLIGDTNPMTYALITSNGLTPTANGMTVGLDTDVNVTSQQCSWIAIS